MNKLSPIVPEVSSDALELLNTEEMIEVDRLMTDVLKIELMQMMENAGRNLGRLCIGRFLHDPQSKHVLVMAGTGGNGGGALVAARRLLQWGANVSVMTTKPDEAYSGVPAHQLGILRRLGVEIINSELPETGTKPDVILDGLIGYSLKGAPRGRAADLMAWANESDSPVLALDTPSGLDSTTGEAHATTIVAAATMTLALPKAGLLTANAKAFVGELYLSDIGVPDWVYRKLGREAELGRMFMHSDIVKIV
ncbi:NAD(P)H-hydrate epimerase [bacterium]|nr:NAD(P)H-hydrate epimerase [bacterium]